MKKLFGILISSVVALTAIGQEKQDQPGKKNQPGQTVQPQEGLKEFYVFRDKRLWHVKDAQSTEVTSDVTLSNGTRLTTQGEVISKTGNREVLEEGQCVDMTAAVSFCQGMPMEPEKHLEPGEVQPQKREPGRK